MVRRFWIGPCFLFALLCAGGMATPPQINYQARLTDSLGAPLGGTHTLYFSIYQGGDDATPGSGTLEFSEMGSVEVADGLASYMIGSGSNLFGGALSPDMFSGSVTMFLEVSVDAPGSVILPRTQLGQLPLAIKSLEAENAIKKETSNYIATAVTASAADNATNLLAAYAKAKTLTPNGQALSATNRATVLVSPGRYDLGTGQLVLDMEFVDVVGLSSAHEDQVILGAPTDPGTDAGVVRQTANDVRIENLLVQCTRSAGGLNGDSNDPAAYFPDSGTTATQITNCEFRGDGHGNSYGMRNAVAYPGTFTKCKGDDASFGCLGTASGTFTDCAGGHYSFGAYGTASGTFKDCLGGPQSFGGFGTASGSFTGCRGDDHSFGGGGTANGSFFACQGGDDAFAGDGGTASGTFTNCAGGHYSYGGNLGFASGTFNNCTGGDFAFAGAVGNATGYFTNCTGGEDSFAGPDGINPVGGGANGFFTNCYGGAGAFASYGLASGRFYHCTCLPYGGFGALGSAQDGLFVHCYTNEGFTSNHGMGDPPIFVYCVNGIAPYP